MKELILILSYCPTSEKKQTLLNFLLDLQPYRDRYTILVASHVSLDQMFFDYFDYFFFDKKNHILTDLEYRQNSWFRPKENYVIWSSFTEIGNTIGPIWDMLVPSLSLANILNYEKIHYFEYDTRISSVQELENNSKLLDEYDYIVYGSENTHKLMGSFLSFKTKSIIDEWKIPGEEILGNLFFGKYPKVPENIIFELIQKNRKYLKKDNNILPNLGLNVGLVRGSKYFWDIPFYDPNDKKIKFISYNINGDKHNVKIVVNKTKFFTVPDLPLHNWVIIDLSDSFEDVNEIVVFRNDQKALEIDFNSNEFREKFKLYNSVLNDESIDPSIEI